MSAILTPIEVFFSYANEDLLLELDKHLSQLRRNGLIAVFRKCRIVAGQGLRPSLYQQFHIVSVILLPIPADFVASDYCSGTEVLRVMEQNHSSLTISIRKLS